MQQAAQGVDVVDLGMASTDLIYYAAGRLDALRRAVAYDPAAVEDPILAAEERTAAWRGVLDENPLACRCRVQRPLQPRCSALKRFGRSVRDPAECCCFSAQLARDVARCRTSTAADRTLQAPNGRR